MDIYKILKSTDFFSSLVNEDFSYIVKNSFVTNKIKGEIIHTPDEICTSICLVLKGIVHSSNYSINGKEQIVCSFKPGQVFGFPVVFGDLTYPEYITADTNCSLLYIPRNTLIHLFDNKLFVMSYILKLENKIKHFSEIVETLSYSTVRERLAKYILKRIKNEETDSIYLTKSITRLAKEMGTDRVVLSRSFKVLEDEGIIARRANNLILILDKDKLSVFA